jgi:N-carbamoylputrescine amidase
MSKVTVAATQMACCWDIDANVERAIGLVRRAADEGAQIILLQELFETPYFCKDQDTRHFDLARPFEGHPTISKMSALAAELQVVLPVSFFERDGTAHYNAIAVIDADGKILGAYRKSHIPQFPGYNEKFYFTPGNTGFRVWETKHARIGVGICWDQWFPEAARAMVLEGAEMLLYPTAIGSEPSDPGLDSSAHWRRVMQGHAAANLVPLVASNRIGSEKGESCEVSFYGSSFIAGPSGEIVAQADRDEESVLTAAFDLSEVREARTAWGVFRDRRPDLYTAISNHAASNEAPELP